MTSESEDPTLPDPPPPPTPSKSHRVKYSLKLKQQDIDLEGADGVERPYTIKEMTGNDRDTFLNWVADRMPKYDAAGKLTKNRDFKDHQLGLIQRCVYFEGRRLSEAQIREWPASAQEFVYNLCQDINSIPKDTDQKKTDDEEKKG